MARGWKCVLAMAAVLVLGCMSPTLPLPPPAAPSELADTDPTKVTLHGAKGTVPPGSTIIIYNEAPNNPTEILDDTQKVTATLVHDDGSWDATIFAMKGDTVTIFDIEEGQWSPSIFYTVAN